jgi:hypothetical protein
LTRFEIGISGTSNVAATNADCAKFADNTEATDLGSCDFTAGAGAAVGCGAPSGLFRVSEFDCLQSAPTDGTGSADDGIYLRATFNRSYLGTAENILAVFEYVASAYDTAPASPTTCFSGGAITAENCSNVTWKTYLKHTSTEVVQPYLMLVPPTQSFVNTTSRSSGSNPTVKQFVVPLAADSSLSILQLSRIHSNLDVNLAAVKAACNANSVLPANSPLCAGIVIYSLTLYRI